LPEKLEYIHLGHDEPYLANMDIKTKENALLIGKTQRDKEWVYSHFLRTDHAGIGFNGSTYYGDPAIDAIIALMLNEIDRRIDEVHASALTSLNNAKILIWADMWDPQHFGGYFGTSDICSQATNKIKENVILMPWQYRAIQSPKAEIAISSNYMAGCSFGNDYSDICATLDIIDNTKYHNYFPEMTRYIFNQNGLKLIYTWAYKDVFTLDPDVITMGEKWSKIRNLPGVMGYCAAIFPPEPGADAGTDGAWNAAKPMYEQYPYFDVMEVFAHLNADLPKKTGLTGTFFGDVQCKVLHDNTNNKPSLLDYYLTLKNYTFMDIHPWGTNPKGPNTPYLEESRDYYYRSAFDFILYCNKRSKKDNLDTVYTYSSAVFQQKFNKYLCQSFTNLQADNTKNGYRLPTASEASIICSNSEAQALFAQQYPPFGYFLFWSGGPFSYSSLNTGWNYSTFCAVKNLVTAPTTIQNAYINGYENYGNGQTISIKNSIMNSSAKVEALAGKEIHVLPEFKASAGSEVHFKIEPALSAVP
jgi:hypothetical protein